MGRSLQVLLAGFAFFLTTLGAAFWMEARAGDAGAGGVPALHALAMTAVFALAAIASGLLLRAGWWAAATLTAAGAALGPFVLLAPPWSSTTGLDSFASASTPVWFRAAVGGVACAWILATAWLATSEGSHDARQNPSDRRLTHEVIYGLPLAVVVVTLTSIPGALSDPGHDDLALATAFGWAVLSAGVVTAGLATARLSPRRSADLATYALPVVSLAVVGLMYGAYNSTGGWPNVAGWVFVQPPIYATVVTAAVLVVSGLAAAAGVALSRTVQRSDATVAPQVADPTHPVTI